VLANGVVVIAKHTQTIPAVTISLALRAGSVCDPPDEPGAMHLLSRVIDRGTDTRSAADIAEALDSRGIALTTLVTRQAFSLVCPCLSEDFEEVLSLLGDIVMHPSIPAGELATRKAEVITTIQQDLDNPAVRAVQGLMSQLYGAIHPYGKPSKGTIETVDGLTRDRLKALHGRWFVPAALTIAIVGDVNTERVSDVAARVFGPWPRAELETTAMPPVVRATERSRRVISMMNKAQADVAYGFATITRTDPMYEAAFVMNNILGQYSMGGRLGDSIRERQGMAYYVSSNLDGNVAPGPLTIRAGVNPANVDRTIASIDEEVGKLVADGVRPLELEESKRYLIGSMPRTLETNTAIAAFLQTSEFFGLGLDYDVRLPERLAAVTLDEVNAAARRLLDPACATIVVAGPYEDQGIG